MSTRRNRTETPESTPETPEPQPEAAPAETETPAETPETETPAADAEPEISAAAAAIMELTRKEAANGSKTPESEALDTAATALADTLDRLASTATAVATSLRAIPAGDAAQGGVKDVLNRYGDSAILHTAWEQRKGYESALKSFREKDKRSAILAQIATLAQQL